jgi:hypothetical protein
MTNGDVLSCLLSKSAQIEAELNPLCTSIHDEYEKISIMIDSGASETVASEDKFPTYQLVRTTASGTTYSSAASQAEDIVNVGQKYVKVTDGKGAVSWAKFQMCRGLGKDKVLGSVSRLVEAGHRVVFQDPKYGSYIENVANGYRTYLRQQSGSYYLDLWVTKMQEGGHQPVEGFARQGM